MVSRKNSCPHGRPSTPPHNTPSPTGIGAHGRLSTPPHNTPSPTGIGAHGRPSTPPRNIRSPTGIGAHMYTRCDVALYHPIDSRDPHHWAIYVVSRRRRGSLHQVQDDVGGIGYYVAPTQWNVQPERARLHETSIFVGTIRPNNLNRVRRFIQQWEANNNSTTWNCQRWVVEIILALRREGFLQTRPRALTRLFGLQERRQ